MQRRYADRYIVIGLKIAYYRKLRGLTQEDLAELVPCAAEYIGHLEAPNIPKSPSLDMLFRIGEVLNVEPYKFLMMD